MKFLAAVFFLTSIACCNPAKKLARQQKQYEQVVDEYIKNHPVRIDTATRFYPGMDSSAFYKYTADSLKQVNIKSTDSIKIKYRDTCTSASLVYNHGYTLGYLTGIKDAGVTTVHDTLVKTISQTDLISILQKENATMVNEKSQALLQAQKNKKYLWWFIIACISNVLTITALLNKKFKQWL